jgi:CBS domain-containing protein
MKVAQAMTKNPGVCTIDDSLDRAAQIMWELDCGCVPVVDASGRAIAMVTDRDVCMAAYTQGKALWQLPVALAASRKLVSVREEDSLEVAQELMEKYRVRRLPVLDGQGRPVGVLSMNDVARRSQSNHGHRALKTDAVVRTLVAIGAPAAAMDVHQA